MVPKGTDIEQPTKMPLPRRVVLLLVWPCLVLTGLLAWNRAPQIVVVAVFLFPILGYILVLQVIEPWLERRERESGRSRAGV